MGWCGEWYPVISWYIWEHRWTKGCIVIPKKVDALFPAEQGWFLCPCFDCFSLLFAWGKPSICAAFKIWLRQDIFVLLQLQDSVQLASYIYWIFQCTMPNAIYIHKSGRQWTIALYSTQQNNNGKWSYLPFSPDLGSFSGSLLNICSFYTA